MLKQQIADALASALAAARAAGALPAEAIASPGVEVPRDPSHGDYATNVAMQLAKPLKMAPIKIAQAIVDHLPAGGPVASAAVAPPGFINLKLSETWLRDNMKGILADGAAYGRSTVGQGKSVLLEYVSANPTGPLHVGHGRWAAVGSTLANLMRLAGFRVQTEFYINDAGNQMAILGRSLEARMRQARGEEAMVPEDGYHGLYMKDVADAALAQLGAAVLDEPEAERVERLTAFARDFLLEVQKGTLAAMGTQFDHWFSERTLHAAGRVEEALAHVKASGHLYEKDGAWWLRSTDVGDDKDRVVVRDNGLPTYLAADIAYHWDKLKRGHETLVNILGADHHGYVHRLNAAVQACGGKPDTLQVIIGQLVKLFRDGEPVRMSKRTGEMVTLQDVIEEVGADAARFFLLLRSTDATLDFDLGLAVKETSENPVFYVQYAYVRINSIVKMAIRDNPNLTASEQDLINAPVDRLIESEERQLFLRLASYPDLVAEAAQSMEPHRMTRFAEDLALSFHQFYSNCRVLTDDFELTRARLALIVATRTVLRNVLVDVLGVSAPEHMEHLRPSDQV